MVFIWFIQSDYGQIQIQTQPGAVCNASGKRTDDLPIAGIKNPQVAHPDGTASWAYPQYPTPNGDGEHDVSCTWQGESVSYSARFQVGS